MTNEEALTLKNGDYIFYKNKRFKVLNVRTDKTDIHGNHLIEIKATGHNATWYCLHPGDISKEANYEQTKV